MKIGEYKAAKDQMTALKKRMTIEKRRAAGRDTVFSPMKRLLANQTNPRSRAIARTASKARLRFAQV